ncbi:MAG: hypothetical protein ABFS35_10860 [Bacteroidota bacterium]
MKKIKLITALLLSTIALQLQSQEQNYELKETERLKDKLLERNVGFEFIGKTKDSYYYMFLPFSQVFGFNSIGSNRAPYIGKYDYDMNLIKKVKTNIIADEKEREYRGVVYLNNTIYLITSFLNADHQKHYFFVQSINSSTLEDNNDLRKIGEIDYSAYTKYKETSFNIELSEDKSKVLIYTNILSRKGEILNSKVDVFDDQFQLKWHKENIGQGFAEGIFIAKEFKINNTGNVFVTGIHYKEDRPDGYLEFRASADYSKATYFPKRPVYDYLMFYYYNNGKSSKMTTIKLPGKFIRELTVKPLGNNQAFCAGIYSKPEMVSPQGFYTFKYNPIKGSPTSVQQKEFKKGFVDSDFDEKTIKKFQKKADNEQEWEPFEYQCNLIKKDNGEYVCIAERFLDGVIVTSNGKTTTRTPVFHYNDLLTFSLSKEGKIKRMDVINKTQHTVNYDLYSSYNYTEHGGKKYFVFSEFIKSESLFKEAQPKELVMVELNNSGDQKRTVLKTYPAKKLKDVLFMRKDTGFKLSENEIIFSVMTVNYKYYAFDKLTIK